MDATEIARIAGIAAVAAAITPEVVEPAPVAAARVEREGEPAPKRVALTAPTFMGTPMAPKKSSSTAKAVSTAVKAGVRLGSLPRVDVTGMETEAFSVGATSRGSVRF